MATQEDSGIGFWPLVKELLTSPLNVTLIIICLYLIYKIIRGKQGTVHDVSESDSLKHVPMKKRDFTLEQLREYDGRGKDGRVLLAVNCRVFDVTRGKRFYGPGGPYGVFAGRDASRGLATFSVSEDVIHDEYDDLSDLNTVQMDSIREWEMQFMEKYDYVGKLLKPGELPTEYSDTEEEHTIGNKEKIS